MSRFMLSSDGAMQYLRIGDEFACTLKPKVRFDYQRRCPYRGTYIRQRWAGNWPTSSWLGSSAAAPAELCGFGSNSGESQWTSWMTWHMHGHGNQGVKLFIGTVYDANNNIVGGATVSGYLTATDTYVGEVATNSNGRYELPTPYGAVAHYLVAYLTAGTHQTGATRNDLIPTNSDGT